MQHIKNLKRKSDVTCVTNCLLLCAGTSLWTQSEIQRGEVHHWALPHDKGQRLGLKKEKLPTLWLFKENGCMPSDGKGFKCSFLIQPSSHCRATLFTLYNFAKNSMWCLIFVYSCFSSSTFADIVIPVISCSGTE